MDIIPKLLLAVSCFIISTPAIGAGGRLPRGKISKAPRKVTAPPKVKAVESCLSDFATPLGDNGFFSADGSLFYHFSRVKSVKQKGGRRPWYRYNIHKVDMTTRKSVVVAAMDLPNVDAAVPHGNPIKGATAVIWKPAGVLCRSGDANYVTIAFDANMPSKANGKLGIPRAVQAHGSVSIVNSKERSFLFNTKRSSILELDFQNFQTRSSGISTPKGEQPLYVEQAKRMQYTWRKDTKGKVARRGLVAYKNANQVVAQLEFKGNDKLILEGKLFGVVQFDKNTNSIRIKKLARWTGVKKNQDYVITLPAAHQVSDAELKPIFEKNKVFVLGMSEASKRRWRRGYIFDYEKGWEVGRFKPKTSEYVTYGGISPDGTKAVMVIANLKTNFVKKILVFSFSSRKWSKVKVPSPR